MKCNVQKVVQFIQSNSKSLGHFVIYEYKRKYIAENKKGKNGLIKEYTFKVKKYRKNEIIDNSTK